VARRAARHTTAAWRLVGWLAVIKITSWVWGFAAVLARRPVEPVVPVPGRYRPGFTEGLGGGNPGQR